MLRSLTRRMKKLLLSQAAFALFAIPCFAERIADVSEEASSRPPQSNAQNTTRATLLLVVFPEQDWIRADAKQLGFDPEILKLITAKMKEAKANGVLVRDGRLIAEWNFGGPPEKRFDIQSCTKSITSFMVGIALMDGLIPNVDVLVKDYWPAFEAGPYTNKITFRHLLTMTAGIVQTTRYGTSQDKTLPTKPAEPGTTYHYLNDQSKALAGALTYLYGRKLVDVANEKLKPLGISMEWGSEPRWDADVVTADGKIIQPNCGYSRARFSASDLARVGHLYLQKGVWKDKRILSEKYVTESLTPCGIPTGPRRQVGDDGLILTGGYGFKWRQHEYDGVSTWGMHGYGHQFCVIIPEYNVVMTKISNWKDKSTWLGCDTFYPLLIRSLKPVKAR